jgi:N-acyl homoserine lactone hydrolase
MISFDMTMLAAMPRIDVLELSRVVAVPSFHPSYGELDPFPVYGFVIHHSDGLIVVDTGIGLDNAFIDELYHHESVGLIGELHRHGIDERDVALIVNSHLHFDHCGQNHALAAPICAQAAEVEAAMAPHYTVPEWAAIPPSRDRVVDGDAVIADGVRVLHTPGHTPGHQAVVITAAHETVVIAAQCIYRSREWTGGVEDHNVHGHDWRTAADDSLARLLALRPSRVLLSHDAPIVTQPYDR